VQPRAARDEVVGWQDATLRLRVTAPPVAGAANTAVVALLARALGVPPSSVSVVRGLQARNKIVKITGLGDSDVRARLESHAPTTRSGPPKTESAREVRAYRSREVRASRSQAAPVSGHPRSKADSWTPLQ